MDIRDFLGKKKTKKKQKIFIVVSILTVLATIIWLYFIAQKNKKQEIIIEKWDKISISWKIHQDNNFPTNTHTISSEEKIFGIKSSSINLNNLIGKNILINWIFEKNSRKYPILDIQNIKDPNSKLIINNNKYFFTNELISLDFSQDIDIRAEKKDNNITIYYQQEPIVQIETFICSKVTPTQNCEQMVYKYTENLNEMFNSYLWYIFYKNKEKSRVTFNDDTMWYIFKTNDNNFLLNISHLINIINSKFIKENKANLITENCKTSSWNYMENIQQITKAIIDDNLIKIEAEWTIENEKKKCKLIVDIRNDREIKNISINEL